MKLSQWTRHLLIYGSGVVLMSILPALLIPIWTHRIGPADYGVLELLNRSQDALLMILSLGLGTTLTTFYQMESDDLSRQRSIYSTALRMLLVLGFLVVGLLLLDAPAISRLLFRTSAYSLAVILMLTGTYFETLFQLGVLYLQSELKSFHYISTFIARTLLAILLNMILVYWLRWGLTGILLASLIHASLFATYVLVLVFRQSFKFDSGLMKEMLRFGLPLVPAGFGMFILNNGDRYFLNVYSTRSVVGIYALGYRLGILCMTLVLRPFVKVWSVTMVDIAREQDGASRLGRIATYLLTACTFSTLGLSLLGPYLVRLLSVPSYWSAYRVIPVVGAAYIFYSWATIMDASFYVTKRTMSKIAILGLSAGFVLLLYWLLIPRYGMMGAAWATFGGFASFAMFTALFAQRVYHINYELGRIGAVFALGLLAFALGSMCPITPIISGIAERTAVTLAFPLVLWGARFLTPNERDALAEYWKGLRAKLLFT